MMYVAWCSAQVSKWWHAGLVLAFGTGLVGVITALTSAPAATDLRKTEGPKKDALRAEHACDADTAHCTLKTQ